MKIETKLVCSVEEMLIDTEIGWGSGSAMVKYQFGGKVRGETEGLTGHGHQIPRP